MSSSERNAKIYGAVETETFITFEGFCKKIYDTEQQEVEVFIDDKRIDTLLANQKIPKIEDTYEVFDTEGFCFTYKLPQKYIGKKHKLEFKNIDGEQLIHSPFSTIDVTNEKYNEYCFLESLKEPIDQEKIKDIYCPNCIGFLATGENLEDMEFVEYIKKLMVRFPDVQFKGFCFGENEQKLLKKLNLNNIDAIIISSISKFKEKINLFIQTINHHDLVPYLIKQNIYYIWFINDAYNSDLTIDSYDSNRDPYNFKQFDYKNTEKISDNYALNFRNKMNLKSNTILVSEIIYFERVKYYFKSQEFKNFLLKK